ncbi:Gluconate 2-dehydrogenase (acceptor) [Gluconacetobacter diazotrophicus PA1 5]|uniref:Cytochrome c n=1 Tax=Gluconacetobacter diazotrophicus TaxID=33996 RepID=A0A7W4FEP3_GLUDI|nr:cytochrome c [Gluconacetobacter diazotrophicus]ACI50946.1 Gluconate 2-dehydrogenase (acceptor) [Gluconacetobacter diazotrophicus PA1 5]MBB2156119.1 cytochrome c [Gluconacetobacter diazotrophicus]TWB08599.1 mono/diheme cytochrome c family protein [Gluconacetobacter diazotrophicus]
MGYRKRAGLAALFGGLAALAFPVAATPARAQVQAGTEAALVAQGAYMARASDCVACHTAPGGKPFAGGLPFALAMGTLYAPNITPDAGHGIGAYTEAEFARAVREGVRRDGAMLYPAMPYPSYARMSDADIHALYVYFMHGVAPVAQPNRPGTIPWPMSMRWPLIFWRALFAPSVRDAQASSGRAFSDPVVARGAYLVEGPGHCGACHTQRAVTMQEVALTAQDGTRFLGGGGAIDGWVPTSLRGENRTGLGRWSEDDIVAFLRTGRIQAGSAFGGMSDAVGHGTQHLTDADLHAIARFLKTLPPDDTTQAPWVYDAALANALHAGDVSAPGARTYVDRCAACHRTDGHGYPTVFPPLAGNPVVMGHAPDSLIHIVLTGDTLRATHAAPSSFVMPGFADRLSDRKVADVVSFIRKAWGNDAAPVTEADVARVRKALPRGDVVTGLPLN